MGTQKFFSLSMIKTQLGFLNKGFSEEFTCRTMLRLASYLWVLAYKYVFLLFGFIFRHLFRLYSAHSSKKKGSDFEADHLQQDETEEENHEFVFEFRFQNSQTEHSVLRETSQNQNTSKYDQFISAEDIKGFIEESEAKRSIISEKTEDSVFQENSLNKTSSNYHQVVPTKDFRGFIEEPEGINFAIQDFSMGLNNFTIPDKENQISGEFNSKASSSIISGKTEDSDFKEISPNQKTSKYKYTSAEEFWGFMEEPKRIIFPIHDLSVVPSGFPIFDSGNQGSEEFYSEAEDSVSLERKSSDCDFPREKGTASIEINHTDVEIFSPDVGLSSRNQFWCFDFEPESSVSTEEIDSVSSDLFTNCFVDEESDNSKQEFTEKVPNSEELDFEDSRISVSSDLFTNSFVDEESDHSKQEFAEKVPISEELNFDDSRTSCSDDEFIELEPNFQVSDKSEHENWQETEEEAKSKEERKAWEDDDDLFDDVLLRHQEAIEQMKVEVKNAKSKGMLPTILEECETPKMAEDLKPFMRIDEKLEQKDRLEEIQQVYKGYAEKMRKLDVLNYQTMHGISFVQLKDQIHQGSAQKSSAMKSLLLPNLLQVKPRRIFADPTLKSVTDLHRNLELVYVGQTCLSWEILHWQYRKAVEILESECEGNTRSYNHVAGEFQQFQVLVERFVENEPFQGPRVQNYAKNRCDVRSILQVPAIKEDSLKHKKDSTVWEDYEVSAAMLTQVIDESMCVFWEFLQADKDEANVILKGFQSTNCVDLQDPSNFELLIDIKTSLQKKDRRLKDMLRSGNCLVKKFQKQQESTVRGALLFAQVELKLVSRVLNMSRLTTDQLLWCQKKLNKINFLNRKLQLEPSFLLFPF